MPERLLLERLAMSDVRSLRDAQRAIAEFSDDWANRLRRHSTLGSVSSISYERQLRQQARVAEPRRWFLWITFRCVSVIFDYRSTQCRKTNLIRLSARVIQNRSLSRANKRLPHASQKQPKAEANLTGSRRQADELRHERGAEAWVEQTSDLIDEVPHASEQQ